jgi:hypothetical protein
MLSITVERDEIGPALQLMAERASDWASPIERGLESELEEARSAISGSGGVNWAPTSPWTLKVDEVLGRTRTSRLQETGELLNSLRVFSVAPTEGEAGTDVPHARYQQEGTSQTFFLLQFARSRGTRRESGGFGIPPSRFLFWREEKLPEYDGIFLDHLMGEGEGNA